MLKTKELNYNFVIKVILKKQYKHMNIKAIYLYFTMNAAIITIEYGVDNAFEITLRRSKSCLSDFWIKTGKK